LRKNRFLEAKTAIKEEFIAARMATTASNYEVTAEDQQKINYFSRLVTQKADIVEERKVGWMVVFQQIFNLFGERS
jgi:hypothetical protein